MSHAVIAPGPSGAWRPAMAAGWQVARSLPPRTPGRAGGADPVATGDARQRWPCGGADLPWQNSCMTSLRELIALALAGNRDLRWPCRTSSRCAQFQIRRADQNGPSAVSASAPRARPQRLRRRIGGPSVASTTVGGRVGLGADFFSRVAWEAALANTWHTEARKVVPRSA